MPTQWYAVGSNVYGQVQGGPSVLLRPYPLPLEYGETLFATSASQTVVLRSGRLS
jgi:hypothetical protein